MNSFVRGGMLAVVIGCQCGEAMGDVQYRRLDHKPPFFCPLFGCPVDLDHDGTSDFNLYMGTDCPSGCTAGCFSNLPGNEVSVADNIHPYYVARLSWGDTIGPNLFWADNGVVADYDAGGCYEGPWCVPASSHFIGVRFMRSGAQHYAWIRGNGSMMDCAFESKPDTPIATGAGYPCTADPNCDGVVNIDDLLVVIRGWGDCAAPCPPTCTADVDHNCTVNAEDLLSVIGHWSS